MKVGGRFFDQFNRVTNQVLILFSNLPLIRDHDSFLILTGQNRQHGMPGVLQKRGKQEGGESGMRTSLLFGLLDTMVAQRWWHRDLSHVQGAH